MLLKKITNTNKNNKYSFVLDDHFFECEMGFFFSLATRPPTLRLGSGCKLIYGRTHTSDAHCLREEMGRGLPSSATGTYVGPACGHEAGFAVALV